MGRDKGNKGREKRTKGNARKGKIKRRKKESENKGGKKLNMKGTQNQKKDKRGARKILGKRKTETTASTQSEWSRRNTYTSGRYHWPSEEQADDVPVHTGSRRRQS